MSLSKILEVQKYPNKNIWKLCFLGHEAKQATDIYRSTIFHNTLDVVFELTNRQTRKWLTILSAVWLVRLYTQICTIEQNCTVAADMVQSLSEGKPAAETKKDGKNICKLRWSTGSKTAKWTATHKPIQTFCHCMSIFPSPVLTKHGHKKLPKVSNDGLVASCSTEQSILLIQPAQDCMHESTYVPIAVSDCTFLTAILSKFKVHTGPYCRLVFAAGLLDGGSLGSGTGWAGNGFHVPQVSSSSSSIFVAWLHAVEATPQSFLSLFSLLCQSFQDFWPFQPHSLLSALQLAALLGAPCASNMPFCVFPCAQQCKQMQSNARRVDVLASNAMSAPFTYVGFLLLLPSSLWSIWKLHNEKQPALERGLVFACWRYSLGRWRMRFQQLAWIIVLPYRADWQDSWSQASQPLISSRKVYDTVQIGKTRSRRKLKTLFQTQTRVETWKSFANFDAAWLGLTSDSKVQTKCKLGTKSHGCKLPDTFLPSWQEKRASLLQCNNNNNNNALRRCCRLLTLDQTTAHLHTLQTQIRHQIAEILRQRRRCLRKPFVGE